MLGRKLLVRMGRGEGGDMLDEDGCCCVMYDSHNRGRTSGWEHFSIQYHYCYVLLDHQIVVTCVVSKSPL